MIILLRGYIQGNIGRVYPYKCTVRHTCRCDLMRRYISVHARIEIPLRNLVCKYDAVASKLYPILQVHFVIKGRIEAYVDERTEGAQEIRDESSGLVQASYLGVWGPGSLWGLNNVLLGGLAEVRYASMMCGDRTRIYSRNKIGCNVLRIFVLEGLLQQARKESKCQSRIANEILFTCTACLVCSMNRTYLA